MLEPKACRFYQAAIQSGLVDAQALQACWDAVPEDKRAVEHIDRRMARQAVQAGVLTLWQAQQLVAGRSNGFKIDRYVLLELIGQGGMGRVYLAKDSRLNRRVAVKILSPERVNNPRAIARFHREALVGAQLQHENLVRIYDEGEANGKCYLVMEYIEGRNIGQMIAEGGPIPPSVSARLARQVSLGLEHAQRKGLIHRDVNPYNILVTRDGIAKLTDLGLAIDLAESERVTRDGATVGTFDYVSPEQARHSHSVDTRSDIYSLGCTLYHMLTGQVPFPSASLPEKLFGHQVSEPEPLRNLAPEVPEGLAAVVARTLRKSPDDRYATPLDLASALEPYADEGGAPSVEGTSTNRGVVRGAETITRQIEAPRSEALTVVPPSSPSASRPPMPVPPQPETTVEPLPQATQAEPAAVVVPPASPVVASPAPSAPNVASSSGDDGLFGLNFAVDLGPEPSLTHNDATSKSKAKPKPLPKAKAKAKAKSPSRASSRPAWLVPTASALGLVLALAGGALAYRAMREPETTVNPGQGTTTAGQGSGQGKASPRPGALASSIPNKTSTSRPPTPKGKQVAYVGADGAMSVEADLKTAMQSAIGSRGYVLLLNEEPLKFTEADSLTMSRGLLAIKAGEGVKPELHVEVKEGQPFLMTGTGCTLKLEGVTIVARYPKPSPTPLILAGGSVVLDRCAFRVEGAAPGSQALKVMGGAFSATGCWFENFDRAVDADCFGGTSLNLRQCVFYAPRPEGQAASGWGVRLRSMPGGSGTTGRRLAMERCTGVGKGFLEFHGFSTTAPIAVDLTACALLTDAIVSWEPGDPAAKPRLSPTVLAWSGLDNRYDVRGKAWVLLDDGKGGPEAPLPDGPADLDAWTRLVVHEREPGLPPVPFAKDPATFSTAPAPADLAVADSGAKSSGADPAFVGPGSQVAPAPKRKP